MIEYEIQAFGQRIGMDSLQLSPQGIVQLNIDKIGSFFLEVEEKGGGRRLLAYLSAPLTAHDDTASRRLLELCDYRKAHPFPLSAGAYSGKGILLTYMDEKDVTAARIENALRFLAEMFYE